jgi:chain length determinant protein tyrosine kinase EpsG
VSSTAKKPNKLPKASEDRSRTIGAILVDQGRLNAHDVDEVSRFAQENNMRFGDAAVRLNLLTQADIDFALAQQFNYPILDRGDNGGVGDEVIAAYNPQSELVEPLRAIRSQLLLRWPIGANRRVLAITSPERGEGRSWFAANLATVFAQIGERTLLIDADMRHPRQHELFNLKNEVGLSSLLTGRAGREIARRIHPQLRLFVAPAGILPPNPQELLGRPVFDLILDRFAEQFDVVILDTPAAADTADAQILAARAGDVLMMARRNHTRHSSLMDAMDRVRQAGINVIGTVLNEY